VRTSGEIQYMHPKIKKINWSSDFAYAVGLITTDGNLSPDGRHFDFTSNDIELIKTFKYCLNIKNKIARKKSTYTNKYSSFGVQFGNVTLYKFLLGIGLMPNKSKRLESLKIPDEFFFDFLRGHLDGDGSIKKYYDPVYKNSKRLYVDFLSASLPHITWIRKRISELLSINGFVRKGRAYTLTFSKRESILLLNRIYYNNNLPQLNRKFAIAKEFIQLANI